MLYLIIVFFHDNWKKILSSHSLLESIPRVEVIGVETIEACTHEVSVEYICSKDHQTIPQIVKEW